MSPQSGLTWLWFLFPLIEPDRRFSRIRLSEKGSRFCPRKADGSSIETNEPKLVVEDLVGVPLGTSSLSSMFGAQPLAKPSASVSFHGAIGGADRAQAEVVGPSDHLSVELCCNEPRLFPSSKLIFLRLNLGSRVLIARAHRVAV